jgi:hypothetical protein
MAQDPKLQDHPWWNHLPANKRQAIRSRSRWRLLRQRFSQRRNLIATITLLYLLVCLIPLLYGASTITILALLPVLLMPALLSMIWWLAWKEYHD